MSVWKLARSPGQANSASTRVPRPLPKSVRKPRNRGSSERPTSVAPGAMPALRTTVRKANRISAAGAAHMPRGRARGGGREDGAEGAAHAADNGGGCENILHVLGETGDVAAPGTHGGAGKRVRAAGVGKGRRHLGDREAQAGEEQGDDG